SASIYLIGATANNSATTDSLGFFALKLVPLGRQSFRVSSVGCESRNIQEILVTRGKEVVLDIALVENIGKLNEVVIESPGKQIANNEMASVSIRSFKPDDTRKFAGTF